MEGRGRGPAIYRRRRRVLSVRRRGVLRSRAERRCARCGRRRPTPVAGRLADAQVAGLAAQRVDDLLTRVVRALGGYPYDVVRRLTPAPHTTPTEPGRALAHVRSEHVEGVLGEHKAGALECCPVIGGEPSPKACVVRLSRVRRRLASAIRQGCFARSCRSLFLRRDAVGHAPWTYPTPGRRTGAQRYVRQTAALPDLPRRGAPAVGRIAPPRCLGPDDVVDREDLRFAAGARRRTAANSSGEIDASARGAQLCSYG
jgi:hypothetical protein